MLKFLILTYVQGWRTGEEINYLAPRPFDDLLHEQQQVGWRRFFKGWLVKSWGVLQQRYYKVTR
jgi:hypothetical protein